MIPASVGFQCPECVAAASGTAPPGPRSRRPAARLGGGAPGPVTAVLLAVNTGVFAVTAVSAAAAGSSWLAEQDSPVFAALVQYPPLVADGQWWRLLTAGFLHLGVVHLLVNMWSLLVLGNALEPRLGAARFGALYATSLVGGTAAIQLFAPHVPAAGASTALFGLFGAVGVLMVAARQDVRPLLVLLAVNLAISLLPGISLIGHLGGLVAGAATTGLYLLLPGRRWVQVAAALALGALLFALAVLLPPGAGVGGPDPAG